MTASGEITPRWEVDEDGWLTYDRCVALILTHPHSLFDGVEMDRPARDEARDALVADVRAARQHGHCPRDTDTLRQARELLAEILNSYEGCSPDWWPAWPDKIRDFLSGETD